MNVVNVVNVSSPPPPTASSTHFPWGDGKTLTTFSDVHSIAPLEAKTSGRESAR